MIATLGARPAPDSALAGADAGERATRLGVYNPGGGVHTVDVDAGVGTPAEWRGAELGPNEVLVVDLREVDTDRDSMPVRVTASGPVLAELRSTSTGGAMAAWGAAGLPSRTWTGPSTRPSVRRDASLATAPDAAPGNEDVRRLHP